MGFFKRMFKLAIGGTAAMAVAVKPRTKQKPDLSEIERYDFAEGGYAGGDEAANTTGAYENAVTHGYGIVMDVRLAGEAEEAVVGLSDAGEKHLSLFDALETVAGRVPVILRLDPRERRAEYFCERVCEVLDAYEGVFAIASCEPKQLRVFRERRDSYIRAQITDRSYASGPSRIDWARDIAARSLLLNLWTAPDMILSSLADRTRLSLLLCRLIYKVHVAYWTVRDMRDYEQVRGEGAIVIFSGMEP